VHVRHSIGVKRSPLRRQYARAELARQEGDVWGAFVAGRYDDYFAIRCVDVAQSLRPIERIGALQRVARERVRVLHLSHRPYSGNDSPRTTRYVTGSLRMPIQLSVVIPTVGRETLRRAVRSAIASAAAANLTTEVIIVDDRPSQRRPIVSEGLKGRFRVFRSGGRGLAIARNAGWRAARGELVAFLDDDDVVCPHHFHRAHTTLRSVSAARGCFSAVQVVLTAGRGNIQGSYLGFGWPPSTLAISNSIIPSSVVVRRVGTPIFFDPTLRVQEDWDAWLRLMSRGEHLEYTGLISTAYVKDVLRGGSTVVKATHELATLRRFADGFARLCRRHPVTRCDVAEARRRMAARYQDWSEILTSGRTLPVNYYEAALRTELGVATGRVCCDLSALSESYDHATVSV
jgi:hypothetical protein